MAKIADILRDHQARIIALEQQVADLLSERDSLDEDIDLGPDLLETEGEALAQPLKRALEVKPQAKTPAQVAQEHGWDPTTFLTDAEYEKGEEVDGAIIMARRALCEEYSRDTFIEARVLDPEYEGVPENMSEAEFTNASGLLVTLPKPSAKAKLAWAEQAEAVMGPVPAEFGLSGEDALDAYRKGGPLWLAMYDHDYLMSLPYGMRQAMAETVTEYAPDAGTDLANDILRADQDSSQSFALGIIHGGQAE